MQTDRSICTLIFKSGKRKSTFGLTPPLSLKRSTIASFVFKAINFECVKCLECTVASIAKLPVAFKYFSHLILYTCLYKSSSLDTLNVFIGFKIFIAVRKPKLTLYINPLSPTKDTLRTPALTSCAPSCFNSFTNKSSKPNKVLATMLKFSSIINV